ncbi:30S ribosomal protein S25e [Pyrobaculum neutrophilum]|uniref:30S ribosomal protein S25e n=1 Tax=Pyrobaculum neutrophilum (strain DSM 2338 / JCM 9278 / NBRC 100436 / V24Sta) TaxID=444157 RepID=B1Y950_PYRNV|nr:30S ribosomal protein S25e [Pyrobaculum neutrophilum]ACB40279.1 30S ribosomal protein S25e [Pyrobaculum neutrophilum V24Sta]
MGGKKRPTLSQLAKKAEKEKVQQQPQKGKKEVKKEEAQAKRTIQTLDEKVFQTIAKEVQSLKVVTPYEVASKYGIKMSIAFKVLRNLRDRGDLVLVSKGHRTEIYVPAGKAKA